MINHVSLKVTDLKKSMEFYARALRVLGYRVLTNDGECAGLGTQDVEGGGNVWIRATESVWLHQVANETVKSLSCLAFTATNKEQVDEFYRRAIEAGGEDNGAPRYRRDYHPGYYAAFVHDPDGNNIEVVFDDVGSCSAIEIAQKYFDLSNGKDLEGIAEVLADSVTYSSENTGMHLGKENVLQMTKTFFESFTSLHWEIHEATEEKPGVILFDFTLTGTKSDGEKATREGLEYVVVHEDKVQHIEVRNT